MSHAENSALQQTLAIALFLLLPAWNYYETGKLRRNSALKRAYYKRLILVLWFLAVIAAWSTGLGAFVVHPGAASIPWLLGGTASKAIAATLLTLFFAAALLPGIRGARNSRARQAYVREYRRALAFFLPGTPEELRWFTILTVSAGICEEILFRGFLMPYLHYGALALSWTFALLVSSIGFGLNHAYEGAPGVFSTALAGFAFGVLFLLTGNLALSILMHIAVNLQLVLVMRPADRTASPPPRVRR
jgi:membrane protease YdiL (CAAX protease family)